MNLVRLNNENGIATLIALIMIGMLTLIGLAALSTSEDEVSIAGNELQEMRAFYAAEAGLEIANAIIQDYYDSTGAPPPVAPTGNGTLNLCEVVYSSALQDSALPSILSTGTLAGLHANATTFDIQSTATSTTDKASVTLLQTFESDLIPLFQFAVFYNNDLEILPGPPMTLAGRVHTNRDLYVGSNDSLRMNSFVTAAGNIYARRKDGSSGGGGDVAVRDDDGNDVTMKKDAGWLDSDHADWYDSSIARWDGRVQDAAHNQNALYVPLNGTSDPHKLIERGSDNTDSYEHKASLKIIDGTVMRYMEDDTWQDVTAAMIADSVISLTSNTFYDQRESKWVDATELDIGKMYDSGYAPRNGVIYFSDKILGASNWPALRLKDSRELDAGLTVASENPLYTLGDYNSVTKKPAALMADAITFLSDNWVDSLGTHPKADRPATSTTINAAYLTGNTETSWGSYNGGFENLPRFLEDWTGETLNWKGSAISLWNSVQADGIWNGTYYSPPDRAWQFDVDLEDPANHPPETPSVRVFRYTGWRQHRVGYSVPD